MRKLLAIFMTMLLFGLLAGSALAANTVITMQLGSPNMTVNGATRPIDAEGTAPTTTNGRTMLPLRAVAEALGLEVEWDAATQTITLTGGAAVATEDVKRIGSDPAQITTEKNVPLLKLNNGLAIPQVGIGTFSLSDEQAYTSVLAALQNGYRHIDTAHAYGNEQAVGRAIKDSGVPREEIWVTSKVWPSEYGEELTVEAIDKMLDRLELEYLDLVYLHQPVGDVQGAWRALEQCVKEGKIRTLGLSNFDVSEELFDEMLAQAEIKPAIMQLECHPLAQRRAWQEKLVDSDIQFESWYPLGGRTPDGESLRENPEIVRIAEAHGKSPVQVIIRWHIQEGFSVLPGSSNPAHIAENIDVYDFALTDEQLQDFIAGTPIAD